MGHPGLLNPTHSNGGNEWGTRTLAEEHTRGEQRLSEMTGDDLLGIANGGEIGLGVPAQQKLEVGAELIVNAGRKR